MQASEKPSQTRTFRERTQATCAAISMVKRRGQAQHRPRDKEKHEAVANALLRDLIA